jgi:hypothetical protein
MAAASSREPEQADSGDLKEEEIFRDDKIYQSLKFINGDTDSKKMIRKITNGISIMSKPSGSGGTKAPSSVPASASREESDRRQKITNFLQEIKNGAVYQEFIANIIEDVLKYKNIKSMVVYFQFIINYLKEGKDITPVISRAHNYFMYTSDGQFALLFKNMKDRPVPSLEKLYRRLNLFKEFFENRGDTSINQIIIGELDLLIEKTEGEITIRDAITSRRTRKRRVKTPNTRHTRKRR